MTDYKQLNHGIALSSDGKTIYASNIDSVFSWEYDASKVLVSDSNRTLVTGMSNSGHTSRTLLLPESKPGLLLVSRGSDGNRDEGTRRTNSGRSQIRMFNISDLAEDDDPYDYLKGGILGWGLRNSVGVAEHPRDGGIWSVENSADELKRKGEDIHKDNPAEEMNFHGYLNGSDEEGANYGYPGCFSIWSTEDFPDRGDMTTGDQFSIGDEDGDSDKKCRDDFVAPRLSFQAHMAPLDIKFNKDGSEAYVTFHGSCKSNRRVLRRLGDPKPHVLIPFKGNRDEPVGYKISSIAFKDGQPTAKSDSMSATKDILKTKDLSECPDRCFRPVGMAWDSKDRLFFSSDATGEIFVLQRSDNGGGGSGGNGDDSNGSAGGEDDGGDSEDGVLGLMQVAPRSAGWAVTFAAVVVGLLLT